MGYTENCLPKALAHLGHDVHLYTSNLNVYGNEDNYRETYESFLGPADQGIQTFSDDGFKVHRLASTTFSNYVLIRGLAAQVRKMRPDFVYSLEIASLQTFQLAATASLFGFRLFAETHQHLSVVKPDIKNPGGNPLKKAAYRLTRTLPTFLASLAVEKCYAISPDCVYVANNFYGVPAKKLSLRPLGTDTELFHPPVSPADIASRVRLRREFGYSEEDILCVYTGRFSDDKNPLALAQAVERAAQQNPRFHSLFVGEGMQKSAILARRNSKTLPFMKHSQLAEIYRMADIAVWPRQESMSMLDAASSGLPLIVSETIGDRTRIEGNGLFFKEDDAEDLARALTSLQCSGDRKRLGETGRNKMLRDCSWISIAKSIESDCLAFARKKIRR